jgi:uncharacterized protein YjiS (DUF1127 family)
MSALAPSSACSASAIAPGGLLGVITAPAGALARFRRRRAIRATIIALASLDDRTLGDIGLHRTEIGSLAANDGFERLRGPRAF